MLGWLMLGAMVMAPVTSRAEWREAATRHFIIYSEGQEPELKRTASDLERYDTMLRQMLRAPDEGTDRLTIYLMPNRAAVRAAMGESEESDVAGFYVASPRGAVAVGMQHATGTNTFDLTRSDILFHEYAHHVMDRNSVVLLPLWYSEGSAEYYAMTRLAEGGVIETGRLARHRLAVLRQREDWIPIRRLLAAQSLEDVGGDEEMLHAQSWLLVHFLLNDPVRRCQFSQFQTAIEETGTKQPDITTLFGDLDALERQLHTYANHPFPHGREMSFAIPGERAVTGRRLRPGEAALLSHEARLAAGIPVDVRPTFAREVRAIADAFPDEARAAALLTASELLAGNSAAASNAVERWLRLEPQAPRALMYRAMIGFDALRSAGNHDPHAWMLARRWIEWARALAPSDPMILDAYYDSFTAQGATPPVEAVAGLVHAIHLVPQFAGLRLKLAADYEARNQVEAAILVLDSLAIRISSGTGTVGLESAMTLLQRLERKRAALQPGLSGRPATDVKSPAYSDF